MADQHRTRKRSRFALPDIETQPRGRSTIRTQAEQEANERSYRSGTAARVAREQGRDRRNQATIEKERRARVAARTPPPPPRAKDAAPKGATTSRSGGTRSGSRSGRGRRSALPKVPKLRGNPRTILVGELVGATVVVTAGRLGRGESPELRDYVGLWCVFLLLAFAVTVSKAGERLAVGLGGLMLLAIVLRDVAPLTKAIGVATTGDLPRRGNRPGVHSRRRRGGDGVRDMGPHGAGAHPGRR